MFAEAEAPQPLDVVTKPTLPWTLDGHLVVKCPACGTVQDRGRRYFGVLTAASVRVFVFALVLAMIVAVVYVLLNDLGWLEGLG